MPLAERAAAKRSLPPPLALVKRPRNAAVAQLSMSKFVNVPPLSQDDEVQLELRRDCDRFEAFAFESPSLSSSSIASVRGTVSKKRLAPPPPPSLKPTPPVPPPSPMLTHDDHDDARPEFVHIDQNFVPASNNADTASAGLGRAAAAAPPPTPIADDFVNDELCLALLDALTPFVDPFDFSSDVTDIETDDPTPPFLSAAPVMVESWVLRLDDDCDYDDDDDCVDVADDTADHRSSKVAAAERSRALRDVRERLACAEPVGVFAAFGQAVARAASD